MVTKVAWPLIVMFSVEGWRLSWIPPPQWDFLYEHNMLLLSSRPIPLLRSLFFMFVSSVDLCRSALDRASVHFQRMGRAHVQVLRCFYWWEWKIQVPPPFHLQSSRELHICALYAARLQEIAISHPVTVLYGQVAFLLITNLSLSIDSAFRTISRMFFRVGVILSTTLCIYSVKN
ncbi:hypothetical protein ARMGADRAFT_551769 [Armillaria gallica]|uniref:Uncharacterized protein n=1 Tax=Armillaria gallica TaxID=47427 RepID=A0A2H3CRQ0_ARMGA|nr:hypothetical protein ARMGADRAFT_551769 [Armillaria gallica]